MTPPRRSPRDPLGELALLQREVNQLIERLSGAERAGPAQEGTWLPSLDVYEARGSLVIAVEVPGLMADALRVSCRDDTLRLSGERRARRPGPGAGFLCMERPHGRFTREIPLGGSLDLARASARLEDGVLTITLPRLKERRGREAVIPVETDGGR
jgi:HSP20 family protein